MQAPSFSLQDQNGKIHELKDYKGKWLVIYFYPKDDTPGCTKEACNFKDNMRTFEDKGITILGVSKDSVKSHKKFEEKYDLNFTLLSDESLKTIKDFNAWGTKKMYGKEYEGIIRKTFIIDPKGEIVKEYPNVKPDQHAVEILNDIEELKK